jgi:hypothetical protein
MLRKAIRQSLVVGLAVAGVGPGPASAGDAPPVTASPRVRVTAPAVSGKRLVGTLLAMDETTLTIASQKGKGVVEVPRSAVTRIELSRRPGRKGKGAKIGALVGLGAALAVGVAAGDDCGSLPEPAPGWSGFTARLNRNLCMDKGETALMASILTVPAGVLLGVLTAGGERWARTTPDRLSLAVKPTRTGGVGAALSVRF